LKIARQFIAGSSDHTIFFSPIGTAEQERSVYLNMGKT